MSVIQSFIEAACKLGISNLSWVKDDRAEIAPYGQIAPADKLR